MIPLGMPFPLQLMVAECREWSGILEICGMRTALSPFLLTVPLVKEMSRPRVVLTVFTLLYRF